MAGDAVDFYAIEDRDPGVSVFAVIRRYVGGLPPHSAPLEHLLSDLSLSRSRGIVREFFITPKGNYACPFLGAFDDVSFHAHEGVAPHPVNLLAHGCEAVDIAGSVGKIEWHNVRLVLMRTSQSSEAAACEHIEAF